MGRPRGTQVKPGSGCRYDRLKPPPVARTPDLRWLRPPGRMSPCLHLTPEFRRRAVELARLGEQPIAVVAKQLSISESCLRNWLAQADADENGSESRLTSAERRELAQLRREKRWLEMENEILKRAAAYFARENILPNERIGWSMNSPTTPMPRSISRWPAGYWVCHGRVTTTGWAGPRPHAPRRTHCCRSISRISTNSRVARTAGLGSARS